MPGVHKSRFQFTASCLMLRTFLLKLWFAYASVVFAFFMLLCFPLAAASYILGSKAGVGVSCFFLRCWGFLFSLFIGIRYQTRGKEKVLGHTPAVFVANHRSFLDTPAAYLSIPTRFKPLGKIEMQRVPFFGWFYPKVVVVVNRNSLESRRKSLLAMKELLANGTSVFIFPEGSMNRKGEGLTAFYEGAFHLAVEMQVPVVPMVIRNTQKLLPAYETNVFPGKVLVQFLSPVDTRNMSKSDIVPLRDRVFRMMLEELEKQPEPETFRLRSLAASRLFQ